VIGSKWEEFQLSDDERYTPLKSVRRSEARVYPRTYNPQSLFKTNPVHRKNQNLGDIPDQAGKFEDVRSHVLSRDIKECRWYQGMSMVGMSMVLDC